MQETNKTTTETYLTDEEVFSNIWLNPRKVFRFLHTYQYNKYVYLLLVFAGMANAFYKNSDHDLSTGNIFLFLVLGGLLGFIGNYFYAALLSFTGSWINGRAQTGALLRVIAFSNLPIIFSITIVIARFIVRGDGNFSEELENAGKLTYYLEYFLIFLNAVLGFWTFVLMVVGISEVQRFSIGKAILNAMLPILIIVIPLLLFFGMFKLLN